MDEKDLILPDVKAYRRAFEMVSQRITEKQRAMLIFHHAQPARAVSATTLAEHVGYRAYSAANLQYGKLAEMIAAELRLELGEHVKVGALVEFVYPDQAGNVEFIWVMRERVALALEELGWVPHVSHYLYPDLALRG